MLKRISFFIFSLSSLTILSTPFLSAAATTTTTTPATQTDAQLSAAISQALTSAQISQEPISVTVSNGNVTLTGSVTTNNDRSYVEEIVSNVPGVKSIDNQLTVTKESSTVPAPQTQATIIRNGTSEVRPLIPDNVIAANINDALRRLLNIYNISVEVSNGRVTLVGNTATINDKTQIETIVKDIPGVKAIDNRIVVGPPKTVIQRDTMVTPTPVPAQVQENPYPNDFAATESDRQINLQIRKMQAAQTPDIVLKTNNGVVTIEGKVRSANEVRSLGENVKNVKGVVSVNNLLVIETYQ